jgi:hypothetical protein
VEEDGELFEEKMKGLTTKLKKQFEDAKRLETIILENIRGLNL